jgi:phospholipid/cholesterol/gamma-HCH transport system permease protein
MEGSTFRPPAHLIDEPPSGPGLPQRFTGGLTAPLRGVLSTAGDMAEFFGRTFMELGGVWRYTSEILRQAGIIIAGSALVILFMQFVIGFECATEGDYVLRGYGASAYSGVFNEYCGIREMAPYMFGYIVAAKIGCGLVAEIGSMRIGDEIDALESIGINPMRYLIATRLVGAWIAFPFIYMVGLGVHILADYFVTLSQIGEVSKGGYETVFWSFANPLDFADSLIKCMVLGTSIVLISMYYGYRASGGPVGVGTATARSMIVNLIWIHVANTVMTMIFWGLNPRSPIGG